MVVVPRKARSKDKIFVNVKSLEPVVRGLQSQGKTIVLTNGVFDLFHVGHHRCLEDARARGDFLIIAVNDDKSAETIKGRGHPIIPVAERMEVLSALWYVDYVTSFGNETADDLIRTIRPDAYAKGTDYNTRNLPERGVLKELGIKPVFVGDKKGHATSRIIQRVRKKKFA